MASRAVIFGLSGTQLGEDERAFLAAVRPWGVIYFRRNTENPDQVRKLSDAVRDALGDEHAPILIDQEGGRVQRIGQPHFRAYPAARVYGDLYDRDRPAGLEAARLGAQLIGLDLIGMGVNVDCLPVLDVPAPGSDAVIGGRAYGTTPEAVTALGRAAVNGLMSAGVLPVMKHVPGHGRAGVDSHKALPTVDASIDELDRLDFEPFRQLGADIPLAMSAHVVFSAVDPDAPATLSRKVVDQVIRGRIGYDGALMTDDLNMGALSGSLTERARRGLAAGCDLVLHCSGVFSEMIEVAEAVPELTGDGLRRTDAALVAIRKPAPVDRKAAEARLDELLGMAAVS
ncbi:beta-N-acetylhexosaminidase [Faunimonas pinastri]|uniref:beta-N-acetylhexosaminidase n=1 Tax=Faunimonas pinastri TaxID=1855383 RepID=A0A1H9CUH5_9HYPH|nr:beta-N-acetylhexosaminidase [Faunimonas pinastri]SEQ04228.1 beta-N-acetylhexosaminidase [Faunimonas pinastri]